MKKPWDRGFITPAAAGKQAAPWNNVETPDGWERRPHGDIAVWFYREGSAWWLADRLIGVPGQKWKLWLDVGTSDVREPSFSSRSLEAVLVWYAIETADRPVAPKTYSQTGRQVGKHATLAAAYGMSSGKLQAQLKGLGLQGHQADMLIGTAIHETWVADFKALEERICNQMTKP